MDIIKKNRKKIILILFILFVITLQIESKAYSEGYQSMYTTAKTDGYKNWYCMERTQLFDHDGKQYGYWVYNQKQFSTVSLTDTTQKNAIHVLGWIACNFQDTWTFYDLHVEGSKHSEAYLPQGMIWEWLNKYKNNLPTGFLTYTNGGSCSGCYEYNGNKCLLDTNKINTILSDGKEYTVKVDFFYKKYDTRQKLMHLSATSTNTKKDVLLDFSKINTAGEGVEGAKLSLSSSTSDVSLSSTSLTSASDGKFGTVLVTTATNNGSFKIKLTETAPNNYLGIPNDVVLTVSYNNGSVTRNRGRNGK